MWSRTELPRIEAAQGMEGERSVHHARRRRPQRRSLWGQRTTGQSLRFCRCPAQGADDQGAGTVRALPALVMSHAGTLRQLLLVSSMVSTTACKVDTTEQQQ